MPFNLARYFYESKNTAIRKRKNDIRNTKGVTLEAIYQVITSHFRKKFHRYKLKLFLLQIKNILSFSGVSRNQKMCVKTEIMLRVVSTHLKKKMCCDGAITSSFWYN